MRVDVYKNECKEIIHRFLACELSYKDCVLALHVAFAE
jgi:hypothetical protein